MRLIVRNYMYNNFAIPQTTITWDGDKLVCVQKGEVEGRGWTQWIEGDELHLVFILNHTTPHHTIHSHFCLIEQVHAWNLRVGAQHMLTDATMHMCSPMWIRGPLCRKRQDVIIISRLLCCWTHLQHYRQMFDHICAMLCLITPSKPFDKRASERWERIYNQA